MSRAQADEEIIVLDSIGSPALSFAVPAALRLLSTQIERARQQKPALRAVTGVTDDRSNRVSSPNR